MKAIGSKISLLLGLLAVCAGAHAAAQVWTCSQAGLQSNEPPGVYGPKAPDNSLIIPVAPDNTGAPGTGLCQLASATPAAYFTRVTQDGANYAWATLASIGLGTVAAPPAAPVVVIPGTVRVSWTPPTTYTDGTPITEALSYNVYRGATAASVKLLSAVAVSPFVDSVAAPGKYFYTVTAVTPGGESDKPTPMSITLSAPKVKPGPPKSIAVTVTVTVP